MHHYEIVFLIHPDQDEQVEAMIGRYRSIIEESEGKVHCQEDWGRRQLAYPIQRMYKARYVLLSIECSDSVLEELSRAFRFNDAVLRSLVLRRDQAMVEPSILARDREKEARRVQKSIDAGPEAPAPAAEQKEIEAERDAAPAPAAEQKEIEAERDAAPAPAAEQKEIEAERDAAPAPAAEQKEIEAERDAAPAATGAAESAAGSEERVQ